MLLFGRVDRWLRSGCSPRLSLALASLLHALAAHTYVRTGLRDFEQSLLCLFLPEGSMQRIFSQQLPDPRSVAESFDVVAASFVPLKELLVRMNTHRTKRRAQ